MVRTAVLVERKVTGVAIVTLFLFCGVAVKVKVEPTSIEEVVAGLSTMLEGIGKLTTLVALGVPQPGREAIKANRAM